jgi:FkbH-like protein
LHERDLRDQLLRAIGDAPLAVIHSSLGQVLSDTGDARPRLLRALRAVADRGVTLAIPTFTFAYCKTRSYHYRTSVSETGLLGTWTMDLSDALRTPHPIYSFAMVGKLTARLAACANSTTWGDDSLFAEMRRLDAAVIMLGCGWDYCTFFHHLEECAQVPYRIAKQFDGSADFGDGPRAVAPVMLVRDLELGAKNDWSALTGELRTRGEMLDQPAGRGRMLSARCSHIAAIGDRLLTADPWVFTQEPRRLARSAADRLLRRQSAALHVAILGHANTAMLAAAIERQAPSFISDRAVEIVTPAYGQTAQAILDENSALNARPVELTVCVDRLEDLLGAFRLDAVDAVSAEQRVREWAAMIRQHHRRHAHTTVVHRFVDGAADVLGLADASHVNGVAALLARCNEALAQELAGLPGLCFAPTAQWLARSPVAVRDDRLWFLGRFPYSHGCSEHLGRCHLGAVLAATGRTARVIVLDLDNTLWGGVLGEEGYDGIQLGGDHPGNAFAAFQQALKSLSRRGIALAICSKNDREPALDALARHPGMMLRPEDFVALAIDWESKPDNVQRICAQLNLRPDQVLFVDDNPAERELMRQRLPETRILDLPSDPTGYVECLLSSPWLECLTITTEDTQRTAALQARSAVEHARMASAGDVRSFQRSLQVKVHLRLIDDDTIARAEQLMAKTNQFNTTTKRYSGAQLRQLVAAGHLAVVIAAEDRFSPRENIGVLVVRLDPHASEAVVDDYLLSCRILGKGIETGVLRWLMQRLRADGFRTLRGVIADTERNAPARDIFSTCGFDAGADAGTWLLDLSAVPAAGDDAIAIVDEVPPLPASKPDRRVTGPEFHTQSPAPKDPMPKKTTQARAPSARAQP